MFSEFESFLPACLFHKMYKMSSRPRIKSTTVSLCSVGHVILTVEESHISLKNRQNETEMTEFCLGPIQAWSPVQIRFFLGGHGPKRLRSTRLL